MNKRELFGRLWRISEGEIEDGNARVFRVLELARCALAEGIDADPVGYLAGQLAQRVYEEPAPGWLVRALFSLWTLFGSRYGKEFLGSLDCLLEDMRQDLALS
jgi:hypothetical protein